MATPSPGLAVSQQGHYAGPATRLAAYVVDQTVLTIVFTISVAIVEYALDLVTAGRVGSDPPRWLLAICYGGWWLTYFAYPWAVIGKTLGMSLLGIRVVRRDGATLSARRALIRAATLPLGFITFGLGFLGIIFNREHRALYDRIAGSTVVYSWDARAAQLRFLAADPPTAPAAAADADGA